MKNFYFYHLHTTYCDTVKSTRSHFYSHSTYTITFYYTLTIIIILFKKPSSSRTSSYYKNVPFLRKYLLQQNHDLSTRLPLLATILSRTVGLSPGGHFIHTFSNCSKVLNQGARRVNASVWTFNGFFGAEQDIPGMSGKIAG